MASRFPFLVVLTSLLLVKSYAGDTDAGDRDVGSGFGYRGKYKPALWGVLDPKYATCSKGKMQSPINIQKNNVVLNKTPNTMTRKYYPVKSELVNHGINVEVRLRDGGVLTADGKTYTLIQMHWHTPSEHTIDGVIYDAELHLVHKSHDGTKTVTAILYKIDKPEQGLTGKLEEGLKNLVGKKGKNHEKPRVQLGEIDPSVMVGTTRSYYKYIGSFTSPPCSENVVWRVLAQPKTISHEQIMILKGPLLRSCKNNSRPVQPINDRKVELFDELY